MHALLILSAFLQTDTAPLMPVGSSTEFQATAYKVEQNLEEGKFDEAGKLAQCLPSTSISLQWDDSDVPADLRPGYAAARDSAIADWTKAVPDLQVKLADKGKIKVS